MDKDNNIIKAGEDLTLAKGQFPVIAVSPWVLRKDNKWQAGTSDDFANLRDCGFNAFIFASEDVSSILQTLKVADGYGMDCIFQQYYYSSNKKMEELVTSIKNDKSIKCVKGYMLKGYPKYLWLKDPSDVNSEQGQVALMYSRLRSLVPDMPLYLTLSYSLSEGTIGENDTYAKYLEDICGKLPRIRLGYDFSPYVSKDGLTYLDQQGLYGSLSDFHFISTFRDNERDFWSSCQCSSYITASNSHPAPTLGMLRLKAFSALAYGSQGIMFMNFVQPADNSSEEYMTSAVNREGERTPVWYYLQQLNSEIARYGNVFLGCTVKRVNSNVSRMERGDGQDCYASGPFLNVMAGDSGGILVSDIENNGFYYRVIVNNNPFKSQMLMIVYITNYTSRYEVVEMTPNFMQSATVSSAGQSGTIKKIELDPGSYAIVRWRLKGN